MAVQTSKLIDGSYTDPQAGTGREIGVKTNLADGRLGLTLAVFDIKLTNVAFNPGTLSPITGQAYVIPLGKQKQMGGDITLFAKPLPQWQLTVNAYKGSVKDAFGNGHLPTTYTGMWSVYTRYDFQSDTLKKFAIGGGAYRTYGRWASASTAFILPDGTSPATNGSPNGARVMRLKDGTMTSMFIDYRFNEHLLFKFTVNNLFDERFALGSLNVFQPNPTPPRTFGMVATYRF
jgi:outer membrane receptor for ferric coprogen and ferric-rhodotorulic acid